MLTDLHAIIVRSGKGDKDRVVMLPRALAPQLRALSAATTCLKKD